MAKVGTNLANYEYSNVHLIYSYFIHFGTVQFCPQKTKQLYLLGGENGQYLHSLNVYFIAKRSVSRK